MIFLTSMVIGISAGLMRSVTSVALAGLLICLSFGVATLLSSSAPSLMWLVVAIAGYNVGLINLVLGMLLVQRLRAA